MNNKITDFKMPFGKYKSKPFEEIPMDYLFWLRSQSWLQDNVGIPLDLFLDGDLSVRAQKMKDIIREALIARGMTDGECKVFLRKLLYILQLEESEKGD